MLAFKFLLVFLTLLGISFQTQAASTTKGKLLKFYPITKQQYKAILRLAQQPAVEEDSIGESHRSLADWSSSLQNSWNSVLNATRNIIEPNTGTKNYPMCVIQAPEVGHRSKRGTASYNYGENYAGIAPNFVYPGTYPVYGYPYPGHDNDDEPDTVDQGTQTDPEKDSSAPVINCVVVIRRTKPSKDKPETETDSDYTHHHSHYPHGYPPVYGYPHYIPYPYPYPYPYPPYHHHHPHPDHHPHPHPDHHPHPHPDPHHHPHPDPHHHPHPDHHPHSHPDHHPHPHEPTIVEIGRNNALPNSSTASAAQYQQVLNEYYKHLHALYRADAATGTARVYNDYYPNQYQNSADEDDKEDDKQNDDYDSEESNEKKN